MLTKVDIGEYKHKAGDKYRIEVVVEGTGKRIVAVLGDKPIKLPVDVDSTLYGSFGARYEINALFTFTQDSTPTAKYTVTLLDANGTEVDKRVVRRPAGSTLPKGLLRLFIFRVVG